MKRAGSRVKRAGSRVKRAGITRGTSGDRAGPAGGLLRGAGRGSRPSGAPGASAGSLLCRVPMELNTDTTTIVDTPTIDCCCRLLLCVAVDCCCVSHTDGAQGGRSAPCPGPQGTERGPLCRVPTERNAGHRLLLYVATAMCVAQQQLMLLHGPLTVVEPRWRAAAPFPLNSVLSLRRLSLYRGRVWVRRPSAPVLRPR